MHAARSPRQCAIDRTIAYRHGPGAVISEFSRIEAREQVGIVFSAIAEPDDEMLEAGRDALGEVLPAHLTNCQKRDLLREAWRAMLARAA